MSQPADQPGAAEGGAVELVRWPADAARREQLALEGLPCLLVLGPEEPAPTTELLEDWVREPLDDREVAARSTTLACRRWCADRPSFADGVVAFRGGWVAVPPAQFGVARLLVERFGGVVRRDELVAAAESSGGSGHAEAVKAAVSRLGARLAPLGLELTSIRGRGHLLQATGSCPLHGRGSATTTKD